MRDRRTDQMDTEGFPQRRQPTSVGRDIGSWSNPGQVLITDPNSLPCSPKIPTVQVYSAGEDLADFGKI